MQRALRTEASFREAWTKARDRCKCRKSRHFGERRMDEEAPIVGASQPMTVLSAGSRGTSQSGVGLYNERLILSLIRRQRSPPKVQIARLTGLSTQTTTVIITPLEPD